MISIYIAKPFVKRISKKRIVEIASSALFILDPNDDNDLSIVITTDTKIQKINQKYRELDQPTDILSFESNEIDPETGRNNLGDIILSFPAIERQANEAQHPIDNECALLLVHGILHLIGFSHNTPEEKQLMWEKQSQILDLLGIKINRISGDENFHD